MAEVSYNDFVSEQKEQKHYDVDFFKINPNTEVLVRIMCDSMADLDIYTVHPVTVGNASFPNREVNCIRSAQEPIEQCPLCAAGAEVKQKVYIKMIQYDEQTHEGKAVVWARNASVYVPTLKKYMDNYGPLSNIFCKVSRTGSGLDSKYDIIPNVNPAVYNDGNFPRKDNAFANYSPLGTIVLDKNAMEISEFIKTGNFPMPQKSEAPAPAPQVNTPAYTPVPETPAVAYAQTPVDNNGTPIPNEYAAPAPGVERPQRYY